MRFVGLYDDRNGKLLVMATNLKAWMAGLLAYQLDGVILRRRARWDGGSRMLKGMT